MFIIVDIISIKEIGVYGTILALFTLFVYFLGWEVWYIYNRKLSLYFNKNIHKTLITLGSQFTSYFVIYSIILPIAILYLYLNFEKYWILIVVIAVSLHLSQEISRILIHIEHHLLASIISLLVQSFWIIIIIYKYYNSEAMTLQTVLQVNAIYSSFFALLSIYIFINVIGIKVRYIFVFLKKMNFKEIAGTIIKSTKFLVSVITFILGIVLGRFFLKEMGLHEENGIFSYFQNISSVSLILLNFGLTSMVIPKLIKNKHKTFSHRVMMKSFFNKTISFSLLIYFMINIAGFLFIMYFTQNEAMKQNLYLLYFINIGYLIINISSFYNSILYVWNRDFEVVFSNIYSLAISVPLFLSLLLAFDPLKAVIAIFIFWAIANMTFKRNYALRILKYDTYN